MMKTRVREPLGISVHTLRAKRALSARILSIAVLIPVVIALAGRAVRATIAAPPSLPPPTDSSVWLIEPKNEPVRLADLDRFSLDFGKVDIPARRSVADRNRNPLNLKLGSDTRRYLEVGLATISEIVPADGGRFLKFRSAETGFRAAAALLSTSSYGKLRIDRALRRWSNNGYGAEILTGTRVAGDSPVPSLRQGDLRVLLHAMAVAEGYSSPATADEIRRALEH